MLLSSRTKQVSDMHLTPSLRIIHCLEYWSCISVAVYFEQRDDDKCIEVCQQAVEKGRELRADFKLIAKLDKCTFSEHTVSCR